jgi:hypothetical protein
MSVSTNEDSRQIDVCQCKWRQQTDRCVSVQMKTADLQMSVSTNEDNRPVDVCQYKWRQRTGRWLSVEMIFPTVGVINFRNCSLWKLCHLSKSTFLFNDTLPTVDSNHDAKRHWLPQREQLISTSGFHGNDCSGCGLLGCDAVQPCTWNQPFLKNMMCLTVCSEVWQ